MVGDPIIIIKREGFLQLLEDLLEGALGDLIDHDFHNLLADNLLLRVLGVAGGLNLSLVAAGESNTEHAKEVAIGGLGLHERLNQRVPLLHEGAELVTGHIEAVEVSITVVAFNFLDLELDLSPGLLVVLVLQVSQRNFEDAATERVSSDLLNENLANALIKNGGTYSGPRSCCRESRWACWSQKLREQGRCTIPS